jgi:arylsulfatase A-like enzyme
VITADHDADSAGRTRIPLNRYHIPLFIYAPAHIQPRVVRRLTSQIDIAPTLLGLLHFNYRSRFFGYNVLASPADKDRAFPSTYANLGYYRDSRLTILSPRDQVMQVNADPKTGDAVPVAQVDTTQQDQAIAFYQVAYDEFTSGRMRWRASDAIPVPKVTEPATAATAPVAAAVSGK